ncbi:conserved protein of unknown function [Magnetospirillum gryphiswaldense MSR-1 v2]|uniref:CheW-like domain-containing protein n=1 Tax=Magnetospirillum gryphiswaldense (strain DSM 6361 / JCM 21280 / NBRC 15271 / MSR-1) TaxID=431944 RepID=V6F6E2_MAGGM|nr:hypothetical protein [Magnetospirillum gryphiswaldense]CDL00937.1 conserved protein of unknown function [Magnetospirillum gryphiswaldense MSR-1 v2]
MDLTGHGVRMVRFSAGGHAFAVEARHVRAMLTTAPEQARQAEDLLGLALLPGPRRWLVMEADGVPHCIEVAEPVRLQVIDAQDIHLPPPLLAARLTLPALIAIAFDHQGPVLVLDPLSLLVR